MLTFVDHRIRTRMIHSFNVFCSTSRYKCVIANRIKFGATMDILRTYEVKGYFRKFTILDIPLVLFIILILDFFIVGPTTHFSPLAMCSFSIHSQTLSNSLSSAPSSLSLSSLPSFSSATTSTTSPPTRHSNEYLHHNPNHHLVPS